jgi:hypothetical protein
MDQNAGKISVTVAVFGPSATAVFGPGSFEGPLFEDHSQEMPWADRLKIELDVSPDETVADVIDRAAPNFGISAVHGKVSETVTGVSFYQPQDEGFNGAPYPWLRSIPVVSEDGILRIVNISEARYGDVLRASERGLIDGDPARLYLWPTISQGGWVGYGDWYTLVQTLHATYEYLLALGGMYGGVQAIKAVLDRLSRSTSVPAKNMEARWLKPDTLAEVIAKSSWSVTDLAIALGTDEETALAVIAVLGFDVKDGMVGRPTSLDGRFERKLVRLLLAPIFSGAPPEAAQEVIRLRLDDLASGTDEPFITWHKNFHDAIQAREELEPDSTVAIDHAPADRVRKPNYVVRMVATIEANSEHEAVETLETAWNVGISSGEFGDAIMGPVILGVNLEEDDDADA